MDIENMHPFCLPFGLCHDATSSNAQEELFNSTTATPNSGDQSQALIALTREKLTTRSKTCSPSDELFRQLNNTCSSNSHRSLLNDESFVIIDSASSPMHLDGDDAFHFSLELDVDLVADATAIKSPKSDFDFSDQDQDQEEEDENHETIHNRLTNEHINKLDGIDIDIKNDWLNSSQYSLLSPTSKRRRKSSISNLSRHNNSVFHHHMVDPIDIKSSPTLAQLNLNTNEDPNDGLWDTTTTTTTTSTSNNSNQTNTSCSSNHSTSISSHSTCSSLSASSMSASTNMDLLSNCTSINRSLMNHHHHHLNSTLGSLCNSNNINTCNHLNHYHNHTHHPSHNHHLGNHYSQAHHHHHHHSSSSPPLCHHVHHNHRFITGNNSTSCSNDISSSQSGSQSTCLAVSPFARKQPNLLDLGHHNKFVASNQHHFSHCCQLNHQTGRVLSNHSSTTEQHQLNPLSQHQNNLKLQTSTSAPVSNCNHLSIHQRLGIETSTTTAATSNQTNEQSNDKSSSLSAATSEQHQRSTSPAQVTSSSSPHANSPSESTRAIDNKLKENIEYLTALLCNGSNKLDNQDQNQQQQLQHQPQQPQHQQQSATISSTMVRSYATLAHTLSTGPKLLERSHQQATIGAPFNNMINPSTNFHNPKHQQQQNAPKPIASTGCGNHIANEATPFVESSAIGSPSSSLRGQQQPSSFMPISDPNQWFKSNVETSVSAADSTAESQLVSAFACSSDGSIQPIQQQQQQIFPAPTGIGHAHLQQSNKAPSSKVLSSLLSANKCQATCTYSTFGNSNNNNNNNWRPDCNNMIAMQTNDLQQRTLTNSPIVDHNKDTPVPPNGKPITLTPISSSLLASKSRTTLFVQPASPSASSTASSGELNAAPNLLVGGPAAKKHRASNQSGSGSRQANRSSSGNRSGRPNSLSTECSLSSHDEGFSSQMDNDDCGSARDSDDEDDDVDSDDESFYGDYTNSDLIGASISDNAENKWTLNMGRTRRNGQKRYFWQYNVQSKGPKGTRICSTDNPEDPFVLPEASDPVFSNDCQIEGVKHSGKARRGDGNDLTPNPRKLLMIGLELKKLSKIINELAPVTDLPLNARNKTRKEKNKLASRACRLKKKAQHEANKIKLYGLQREHQQVVNAIFDVRKLLNATIKCNEARQQVASTDASIVSPKVFQIADGCVMKVASETSNYVNEVLEKVVSGCIDGGLQT